MIYFIRDCWNAYWIRQSSHSLKNLSQRHSQSNLHKLFVGLIAFRALYPESDLIRTGDKSQRSIRRQHKNTARTLVCVIIPSELQHQWQHKLTEHQIRRLASGVPHQSLLPPGNQLQLTCEEMTSLTSLYICWRHTFITSICVSFMCSLKSLPVWVMCIV